MQMTRILLLVTAALFTSTTATAQTTSSKGVGTITWSGWSLDEEEKAEALLAAKVNALERYVANQNQSLALNYEAMKNQLTSHINDYVLDALIVDEQEDDDAERYSVIIRATINELALRNRLQSASAVANASDVELSAITFVFVAREQKSVKTFDARVVSRVDTAKSESGAEYQAGGEYSAENIHSTTITSGGSQTQKADVIEYDVSTTQEVNNAMGNIFSTAGFEVVEAEYLETETQGLLSLAAFKKDYQHGQDISPKTLRNAVEGVRKVEVPYLALGTLDVGMKDIDPTSGLTRIYVTVTGKIMGLQKRFPKTVASVGPVQYAGLGPNSTVARTNALKLAAEKAAQELTDQLNAKGIK